VTRERLVRWLRIALPVLGGAGVAGVISIVTIWHTLCGLIAMVPFTVAFAAWEWLSGSLRE
jgi:hypothetical protein